MNKKLLGIVIILILIAIPLTVFIAQKQQEVRQRATGEEANIFFTGGDQTPISQITLTPGRQATLALYVDTGAININGFDITVSLANALSLVTINDAVEGADASKFNSSVFRDIDRANGAIRFAKVSTDSSQNINGRLHLGSVIFTVNTSAQGSGNIGVTAAQITSPGRSTELTKTMPTLSYTISTSSTVTPPPTNTPTPTSTPISEPAGWWKFNENSGTIASDSSGSGYNGTLNGGASWTSGRIAGGLALDGNQYMDVPNSANSLHSDRQITIAGWFKLSNLNPQWSRIFWKGNPDCATNCDNREYSLWVKDDGLLHFTSTPADKIGTGQVVCNSPTGTIQANQWYHFAAVLNSDANSMKSYINGVEKGSCSYSTSNIRTTDGTFQIGNELNGTVDDYRIYKRALSGAEITAIYENITTPTPTPTVSTTTTPSPTCTPPPPCLNAVPRCLPPEPPEGWCITLGTQLSLTVTLPGIIGVETSSLFRPNKPQRKFTIELFDSGNKALPPITSPLYLDRGDLNSATFVGNVDLGTSVPAGNYIIKVKTNKFLRKLIPGFKTISPNTTITLPAITLINGDINNDNVMNIADYNILASCFGEKMNTASCGNNKENADLNEDGKVDQVDYNIFLRNIQAKQGD